MKLFSNGLKGWKQSWKGDLRASISVAFIAIPLGLGIGLASGVPPLAAVIPCVVGGLFVSWISGGNITVHSTPKMLIGVTAAAVVTLGGTNLLLGYQLFLAAVVIAGGIQLLLGLFRLGVIGDLIPASVIKSLLSAVGVIIIVKQIPDLVGSPIHPSNIIDLIKSLPELIQSVNPPVLLIGSISLAIMFLHPRFEFPIIKAVPSAVWVVLLSIAYSYTLGFSDGKQLTILDYNFAVGSSYLIDLPSNIVDAIATPNFSQWKTGVFWNIVVAVAVISSIEGVLSAKAIDRLDPLKRKSNLNKELRVVGLGTIFSGFIGGLPIIPGIVPSSVGVSHNGKGQLMDVFQALLVLALVVLLSNQLQHIPLAALAGILVHTGYKLFNLKEILNIYRIGWDQIIIFSSTLIITLMYDLIVGISIGILVTLTIHIIKLRSVIKLFTILFRPNVVAYQEYDEYFKFHVSVKGYCNFLNYPRLKNAMDVIPSDASINLDLSLAEFIDHTVMEHLAEYEENHIRRGGNFEVIGIDKHFSTGNHPLAMRFKKEGKLPLPEERILTSRQQKMQALAQKLEWGFDLSVRRYITTFEKFHFFKFKTVDSVYNKLIGTVDTNAITIQDVDFHEGELQFKSERQTTVAILGLNEPIPLFTIEKENFLDRVAAFAGYDDIDFQNFKKFSNTFRLKGDDEKAVRAFFKPDLLQFLEEELQYKLESAGNSILIIGKERPMSEAEVQNLIHFCTRMLYVILR
ncbi:MAG: hypothetical protein K9G41_02885 [Flavobacteriales bacterium]|nr:hypothetical protein [Flavobacteriales bacterium]